MAKSFKRLALVVGILIVGTSITAYTDHYITKQESMYAIEDIARPLSPTEQADGDESRERSAPRLQSIGVQESVDAAKEAEILEEESAAETESRESSLTQPMKSSVLAETSAPVSEAIPEQEILTDEAAARAAKQPALASVNIVQTEETPSAYEENKERLEELDRQIQQMRDSQVESTAYSIKSLAETERKLWETELNNIYTQIMGTLNGDEQQALARNQRQWMNDRDAQAEKTAPKSSGGSIESAEYTASLAASTRQRVYDLLESYQNYLK